MSNSSAKEQIGATPPKAAAGAKLLTPKEAAQFWRVSESFLAKARMAGDGPPFIKIGRSVRYSEAALYQWMKSRQRLSTSEEKAMQMLSFGR